MKTKHFSSLPLLTFALITAGCVTDQPAPPPPPPQKVEMTAKVPSCTAADETKTSQDKGGIEIAIVPVLYNVSTQYKYDIKRINADFSTELNAQIQLGDNFGAYTYVLESAIPFLAPAPDRIKFSVRINNRLPRVFRGQGAVVQLNVGGKMMPFDKVDYAEFVNGIVPPRNEGTFEISGPKLSDFGENGSLPESGTIGVFIYDVVTAIDDAGNVTEKQNFEWYFTYSFDVRTGTAEIKTLRHYIPTISFNRACTVSGSVLDKRDWKNFGL